MSAVKKTAGLFVFIIILGGLANYFVFEPQTVFTDSTLPSKNGINLFKHTSSYLYLAKNALVTQEVVSTGMYTGDNYENYKVIFKIPPEDSYLLQSWNHGNASVCIESTLQKTTEWIVNNKYRISIYYYSDECETQPIYLFQEEWVGKNQKVSCTQPLPPESRNKSIYIDYESTLGSFLYLSNGNDVRFLDNYLSLK